MDVEKGVCTLGMQVHNMPLHICRYRTAILTTSEDGSVHHVNWQNESKNREVTWTCWSYSRRLFSFRSSRDRQIDDRNIYIWNIEKGIEHVLVGHTYVIANVIVLSKELLSIGLDNQILEWI